MALDGFVVSNLVHELNNTILNGRINKIYQPENEEIVLIVNNNKTTYKLLISVNASIPLVCLSQETKENPQNPPPFCMLLRKHLNNARIVEISQPSLERIIRIKIEHIDELGDFSHKYLIIELMGRHSNLIFCEEDDVIIDSIIRVSHAVSSVREVLPKRDYFEPEQIKKLDPFTLDYNKFDQAIFEKSRPIYKAIYTSITGFSPLMANELCYRADVDASMPANTLSTQDKDRLFQAFLGLIKLVENKQYEPNIVYENGQAEEFSCFVLSIYKNADIKHFSSISKVLETYYGARAKENTIKQKSANLRKIVSNAIERTSKKLDLQQKQYKDTEKRDKYRIYGELINTYGYNVDPKDEKFTAINYYNGQEVTIHLDPNLSMAENSQKFFKRYNKLKRTYEALTVQIKDTKEELSHLDTIQTSLNMADSESDLAEIKEELMDFGYVKRRMKGKKKGKKKNQKSKPHHYISSDGFHMYVGRNNYQNDELTFKEANNNDWWFHTKEIPGSHVIVKLAGAETLPDTSINEAASLAAYYSKGRESGKVDVDYTLKKHLNKPRGGKPGFVTYQTYKSIVASTDIRGIKKVE